MAYLQYLKLYTKTDNNYGRFTKRGRKNNYWIHSLKINDKVDVFDDKSDKCWHIATVIGIEHKENVTKLFIHYDGWSKYNEWIRVDHSQLISTKLQKLHTFTPYHYYLLDPSKPACKWSPAKTFNKCSICKRKCCNSCFILETSKGSGNYQCKSCISKTERNQLFESIYTSLYHEYDIDINIIHLITDYSTGFIVSCSNTIRACDNEIWFDTKLDALINGSSQCYQYSPKYRFDGTISIDGEWRRIFCRDCCCYALYNCYECGKNKEVINTTVLGTARAICHDHIFETCAQCEGRLYHEKVYCMGCRHVSCLYCFGFYGLKLSKEEIMKMCSICGDTFKKSNTKQIRPSTKEIRPDITLKLNEPLSLHQSALNENIAKSKQLGQCNNWADISVDVECDIRRDSIIYSKYEKRRKSKKIKRDRSTKINHRSKVYYKTKMDKISNIRQNRRFNSRYALALQY